MKFVLTLIAITCIPLFSLAAVDSVFSLSDLSSDEKLMFTITADQPGWGTYTSLFEVDLAENDKVRTHTFFPERSRYFPGTAELEIQNRYGLYRISPGKKDPVQELEFHPSFSGDAGIPEGRILPVSSSPDGQWILEQEADSHVRGRLVLYHRSGGAGRIISTDQVLEYRDVPALWSPDSRYFLYSKNGMIYYVSLRQLESSRIPDEKYREFGKGLLSSVQWTSPDSLYYMHGSELNLVRPSEMFTGSFYLESLTTGIVAGIIPLEFDPNFDSFWPSPDGSSVILLKGKRNLFRYSLNPDDKAVNLPFLLLPGESTVKQLWWRSSGDVFLLAGGSLRGGEPSDMYYLSSGAVGSFEKLSIPDVHRIVPSPDRSKLALLDDSGISIRNPDTMEELYHFDHPQPRDLFWMDSAHLLIVGAYRIELAEIDSHIRDLICLSQVEKAGLDSNESLRAFTGGQFYLQSSDSEKWIQIENSGEKLIRIPKFNSSQNRVFLEENSIIIRTINGFGNRRLFVDSISEIITPVDISTINFTEYSDKRVFIHGSRTQGKTVALVFNGSDGDEGLGEVLNLLRDYDLRVTFFIGGDFIRRNPESTRNLAASGHEIGSLFYTSMDMTDIRYRIDKNFVVRGLGRNEDSFFLETGNEVSTIWHAPWYVISPPILEATEEMNYLYIGRDVDPLDWVVKGGLSGTEDLYRSSPDLVEHVLNEVKPGSIIPVLIGKPGKRDDYFFQKLDLLINGLLHDGYEIVTVNELREQVN